MSSEQNTIRTQVDVKFLTSTLKKTQKIYVYTYVYIHKYITVYKA